MKDATKRILCDANYQTYDFSEDLVADVQQVNSGGKRSETLARFSSKPDLVSFDAICHDVYLIEVKFRNRHFPFEVGLRRKDLLNLLKYWSDTILVVVIPASSVFYVQRIGALEEMVVKNDVSVLVDFDLSRQFVPLEIMFPRILPKTLDEYRRVIRGLKIE